MRNCGVILSPQRKRRSVDRPSVQLYFRSMDLLTLLQVGFLAAVAIFAFAYLSWWHLFQLLMMFLGGSFILYAEPDANPYIVGATGVCAAYGMTYLLGWIIDRRRNTGRS